MMTKIKCGSVFRIKHGDAWHEREHYAVVCNSQPIEDEIIVFGIITTNELPHGNGIDLFKKISQTMGNGTAIYVPAVKFHQLDRLSLIDCNRPEIRNIAQLCDEVNNGTAIFYHPGITDMNLVINVTNGILKSAHAKKTLRPEELLFISSRCKSS